MTLIVRSHGGPLQIAFDPATSRVTDIGGRIDPAAAPRFLFTGIYVVNPEFIPRIPPHEKISVVKIFCEMIRAGAPLGAVLIDEGGWQDLGTREQYLAAHTATRPQAARAVDSSDRASLDPRRRSAARPPSAPAARIGGDASMNDCICLGRRRNRFRLSPRSLYRHRRSARGRHPHPRRLLKTTPRSLKLSRRLSIHQPDNQPFPAFCAAGDHRASAGKRRIGPEVLPHRGERRAFPHPREIWPAAGREPALRRHRAVSSPKSECAFLRFLSRR